MIYAAFAAFLLWEFIALTYFTYYFTFRSPNLIQGNDLTIPNDVACLPDGLIIRAMVREKASLPYEKVRIKSFDGLTLFARYYERKAGAPIVIAFHGYRGTPLRDRCCDVIVTEKLGYNLLLPDERSHGKSEGKATTFGALERYDCVSWANYVCDRFGEDARVFLDGVSMGATAVLLASSLPLPRCVRGIVADSPYTTPEDVIGNTCRRMKISAKASFPIVRLSAKMYGGFSLAGCDTTESVKDSPIPILLIRGERDRVCPKEMSDRIFSSTPGKITLVSFPLASHGLSYLSDPPMYVEAVRRFAERCG